MKYVRTKDRVSLLRQPITMENRYIVKDSDDSFEVVIDEETLLKRYKVADTIEELCDCFVVVKNRHIIWDKQQWQDLTLEEVKESYSNEFEVYGAIWTEKGLIYVAKLNKKGDLELC